MVEDTGSCNIAFCKHLVQTNTHLSYIKTHMCRFVGIKSYLDCSYKRMLHINNHVPKTEINETSNNRYVTSIGCEFDLALLNSQKNKQRRE